jgi:branched-chain amino acid transport system ATP-binding protein
MVRPALELESLSKRFGALVVTADVTLSIPESECHALIGPNGAGKTTLIGQISGSLAPDHGRIRFFGEDITGWPMHARARRGLARTFQITNVLPEFSALENVALAVQAHSGSSFRFFGTVSAEYALNEQAMEALETMGLASRAQVPAWALNYGEKRQLELAMAIAGHPRMLLLDEPMAGTGREETDQLVRVLERFKGHYTMLLIEHDMSAIFALADRISVMVYGRLIATGAPEAIRANREVQAAYLGEDAA